MRMLRVIMTDLFCCRMKRRSTFFIILCLVLFVMGNYIFMLRMNKGRADSIKSNDINNQKVVDNKYPKLKRTRPESKLLKEETKNDVPNNNDDSFREIVITEANDKLTERKSLENVEKTKPNSHKSINNGNSPKSKGKSNAKKMALLVLACNRIEVRRCLDKIFRYLPNDGSIPVIVSQDCGHQQTASVIRSYGDKLELIQHPNLGPVPNVPGHMHQFMGYYKISRHYKWALTQVFLREEIDSVIILEDDIDIAPDFFDYFIATRKLMDVDESIFCVSAWNDNGKEDSVDHSAIDLLYRSDFFPGLGWLLTRKLWEELGDAWPKGFWDDWMRDPKQRQDRVCIRPEISRTKTFGRIGVSLGQFYDQYLKYIKLNSEPYPFVDYDLSYLTKSKYDDDFLEKVYSVPEGNVGDIARKDGDASDGVRITYHSNGEFTNLARSFGIMTDLKAGVPRTAYKGVVTFYRNNKRIYIAPPKSWKGYTER